MCLIFCPNIFALQFSLEITANNKQGWGGKAFVDSNLLFWRMELDELACASIPMSLLGTNYLSHDLALWSDYLAAVLPFPTVEFAPPACAQGSITQDIRAAHITPTHSPTLPSWPFASPHPKARGNHWPS